MAPRPIGGRGFTLVELLVTVLVMVILMGVSFRLMHGGDDAVARSRTHDRLQRLQNCLSGYRAAFGHYPAVPLHGVRDIYLEANDYGIQTSRRTSKVVWRNVRAAILSQPVTTEFPFDTEDKAVKADVAEASAADIAWAKAAKSRGGDATAVTVYAKGYKPFSASLVATQKNQASWRDVQVFRYGLLSYLLPRAQFMLFGEKLVYEKYAQWPYQNELAEITIPRRASRSSPRGRASRRPCGRTTVRTGRRFLRRGRRRLAHGGCRTSRESCGAEARTTASTRPTARRSANARTSSGMRKPPTC